MALRGTLTHRKTRRLARETSLPLPCALGLMEALWHVTAEQAPTGAIGKLSNQDIADEMFWEGDADSLIEAFIAAGLIDECATNRLVIHDWTSHADQATRRKVARHGLDMASQELVTSSTPVPESSTRVQSPGSNGVAKADPLSESVGEVVTYFNTLTGKRFTKSGGQAKHISGRLREGVTVAQLKLVADFKVFEWSGNGDMEKYLRPETVFGRGHWEDYLQNAEAWNASGRTKATESAYGGYDRV